MRGLRPSCSTLRGDVDVEDDEDYLLFTAIAKWFVGGEGSYSDGGLDLEEPAATSGSPHGHPQVTTRSQRVTLVLLFCFKQLLLLPAASANFRTF